MIALPFLVKNCIFHVLVSYSTSTIELILDLHRLHGPIIMGLMGQHATHSCRETALGNHGVYDCFGVLNFLYLQLIKSLVVHARELFYSFSKFFHKCA